MRALSLMLILGTACAASAEPVFPLSGPLAGSGGRREWREERRGEPREVRTSDRRQARRAEKAPAVELTKGEQAQLDVQMKRINELEQQLRKPGLSATERARLQLELTRAAREITKLGSGQRAPAPAAPSAPPPVPPPSAAPSK